MSLDMRGAGGGLRVIAFALSLMFLKQVSCDLNERVLTKTFGKNQILHFNEQDDLALLKGNKKIINGEKPKV